MLLPNLYKTLSVSLLDDSKYEFTVEINQEDSLFKGHFPERPVLPGVCTIQIIRECVCSLIKKNLHFMEISQCKFMGMVVPDIDNKLTLQVSFKEETGGYIVNANIVNSGRVVFKIKGTLMEVDHV